MNSLLECSTGKLTGLDGSERTYALLFLKDGTLAAAAGRPGQEGDVCLYDVTGALHPKSAAIPVLDGVNDSAVRKQKLLEADDVVLCLALSPDGKQLAAGNSADRTVDVWDIDKLAQSAKPAQVVENHADWVFGVSFLADGKHLLTSSRDKTAKVWDLVAKESSPPSPNIRTRSARSPAKPTARCPLAGEDNQVRFWNPSGDSKRSAPAACAAILAGHASQQTDFRDLQRSNRSPGTPTAANRSAR